MFIKKITISGFRNSQGEKTYNYSNEDVNILTHIELDAIQLVFNPFYGSNYNLQEFVGPNPGSETFVEIECQQDEKRLFLLSANVTLKRNLRKDSKWIFVNGNKVDANVVLSIFKEGFLKLNGLDDPNILSVNKIGKMEQMHGPRHWKLVLDLFGPRKLLKLMSNESVIAKALREHEELTKDRQELYDEVQTKQKQMKDANNYNKLEKRFNTLQNIHSAREIALLQVDINKIQPQIDEIEMQYSEAVRDKYFQLHKIFVYEETLKTYQQLEKLERQIICDLNIKKGFLFNAIDANEKYLLDADNFDLSKRNYQNLLVDADRVYQKLAGIFKTWQGLLFEKNQLETKVDLYFLKLHIFKSTEETIPSLMNYIQTKLNRLTKDKVLWGQHIGDLNNLLTANQEVITEVKKTDVHFNAYISQFPNLQETCKTFHKCRYQKLKQIDTSTKEILEASIDKLKIVTDIENFRNIGGFDKKIIEGLVNVEFFMSNLNEDNLQDKELKDDYVGPVFMHLRDDDVELESHFWEQIRLIATHLLFRQYKSLKNFKNRFQETNYSMIPIDAFFTASKPGLPTDLNIEQAIQLVLPKSEFYHSLNRIFQEIIHLSNPEHLKLFLKRRYFVMYDDGSQSYYQGAYSGGAMAEDQIIQTPEHTRVKLLQVIYENIKKLVFQMKKISTAELTIQAAQNWLRDNEEQQLVNSDINHFDISNPNFYLKHYQHTKDLINAQSNLYFIDINLVHYQQLAQFNLEGDFAGKNLSRLVMEGWKNELVRCGKMLSIFNTIIEQLGCEMEGIVDSLHFERVQLKTLMSLHSIKNLDKTIIRKSIEYIKKELIFVDQSIQEYKDFLKSDLEEIIGTQEPNSAAFTEIEVKVEQLKNELAILYYRSRTTKSYMKEFQDIIDKFSLTPERLQTNKVFKQMEKMPDRDLVKALLASKKALFEAYGSLTAGQREKLANAIEDSKDFQKRDKDVKQSSVKVYPHMNRHLISAMQTISSRLEESCKLIFDDYIENCQFVLNMQTDLVGELTWETFDFASIKSLDLKMKWNEGIELPFEATVNCIRTIVLITILVQQASKIKFLMVDQEILTTFGPVLEEKMKQFLKIISPQVQSFIFKME